MHMSFWFGTDLGSFIFPGYKIVSFWEFFATCLALISLAIVYEAMKVVQIKLRKKTLSSLNSGGFGSTESSSLLNQASTEAVPASSENWNKWARWILEVLHWSAHTTLGYLLMLAVMTYNAYIGIALVIGASFGYWIFGMTLIDMNLAQFQEVHNKIVACDPQCSDAVDQATRQVATASNAVDELIFEVSTEIHAPAESI